MWYHFCRIQVGLKFTFIRSRENHNIHFSLQGLRPALCGKVVLGLPSFYGIANYSYEQKQGHQQTDLNKLTLNFDSHINMIFKKSLIMWIMSVGVMGASGKSNPRAGIFPQRSGRTPGQEYDLLLWDPVQSRCPGVETHWL